MNDTEIDDEWWVNEHIDNYDWRESPLTNAFVDAYQLDARRCISYLTIEIKGAIPRDLRPAIGNRVFGCDDCQEVCPWNKLAVRSPDPAYANGHAPASLLELAELGEAEYFERFRGTPVRRARWRGLLRNVMVALGNWGNPAAIPGLQTGLRNPEPLVRQHAAWGLGRVGGNRSRELLRAQQRIETEPGVTEEIEFALQMTV